MVDHVVGHYHEQRAIQMIEPGEWRSYDPTRFRLITATTTHATKPRIGSFYGFVCKECLAICALEGYRNQGGRQTTPRQHACQLRHISQLPDNLRNADSDAVEDVMRHLYSTELRELMLLVIDALERELGRKAYIFAERVDPQPAGKSRPRVASTIVLDKFPQDHWVSRVIENFAVLEVADYQGLLWDFLGYSGMSTYAPVAVYYRDTATMAFYYHIGIGFGSHQESRFLNFGIKG